MTCFDKGREHSNSYKYKNLIWKNEKVILAPQSWLRCYRVITCPSILQNLSLSVSLVQHQSSSTSPVPCHLGVVFQIFQNITERFYPRLTRLSGLVHPGLLNLLWRSLIIRPLWVAFPLNFSRFYETYGILILQYLNYFLGIIFCITWLFLLCIHSFLQLAQKHSVWLFSFKLVGVLIVIFLSIFMSHFCL